jgi:putative thioredoxin
MDQVIGMTAPGTSQAGGDFVKDTNTEQFMADVIDASAQTPIIVDFWAPWCGPCKQLGPALEKAVREAKGAVRMVKVNIDENQELAAQMRIQSIPAVYAFYQGRPVDGFVGALPESQIKSFVQRLVQAAGGAAGPSPVEQALEQAKAAFEAGDTGTASALFGQVLAHDSENAPAAAGLARCYLQAGDVEMAKQVLDRVPADQAGNADVQAARTTLELAEQASAASGASAELAERLQQNPNDHQARYDLAVALYAQGEQETAVDELLELFRRDRNWNDQAARKQLVKLFEALGPTDPLTLSGRRRLSSLMFS